MLTWTDNDGLPAITLGGFVAQFAAVLPKLLAALKDPALRQHPIYGEWIPYDVLPYGNGESLGHCIRPDIILTADGPRVCEMDFVPSGRGFCLSAVPDQVRVGAYLDSFGAWYGAMETTHVAYATATTTTCWKESLTFSDALRQHSGIDISAVNIDETPTNGAVIDRLFYASEMRTPQRLADKRVLTAEPHLDSKMVMALVHDPSVHSHWLRHMSAEDLAFLRQAFPVTFFLPLVRRYLPHLLEQWCANERKGKDVVSGRNDWVVKNADVESDECWGSRGVIMGRKYGEAVFRRAVLEGVNPNHKVMGDRPVLQRFSQSVDFAPIWNALASGELSVGGRMGLSVERGVTSQPARKAVAARVGFYCLVANTTGEVFVPPCGVLTLRQDDLVHGASDANYTAFEIAP